MKLVKVNITWDGATRWTLSWPGQSKVLFGDAEVLRKKLAQIKCADTAQEPRSKRSKTYKQMVSEIKPGTPYPVYAWDNKIKKVLESHQIREVSPQSGESQDDFHSRCMSKLVGEEGYDQDQANAICYSKWERRNEQVIKIDEYTRIPGTRILLEPGDAVKIRQQGSK